MSKGKEKTKIAWHPAFCSAAEFDLREDRDNLSFEAEHQLSKEPLRMDLLIIKKEKNIVIDNDIAKIFRKYNVIEYKSPDDGLTIDDFYKTVGYACLYKGTAQRVNEIPADELTVSIFRESYPKKLLEELTASGLEIENAAPGVYVIKDMKPFPAQIIVMKELNREKHAGLRILSKKASEDDIENFIKEAKFETLQGEQLNINAILEVSYAANQQLFDMLKRRDPIMSEALQILMKEELNEAEARGRNDGISIGEARGISIGEERGISIGRQQGQNDLLMQMIANGEITSAQAAKYQHVL